MRKQSIKPDEFWQSRCDVLMNSGFRWKVNPQLDQPQEWDDDEEDAEDADEFENHFESEHCLFSVERKQSCPYCDRTIPIVSFEDDKLDSVRGDEWALCRSYFVASCATCGFWKFLASESTNKCMDAPTSLTAASVVRRFDSPIPPSCAAELAQYLSGERRRWDNLSPKALEILVADIFRANYEGAEVVHVGKPGDLGVDVLFVDSQSDTWLIQVKRRRSGKVEGFATLQSLLGTLVLHDQVRGIVVSTADYFSACVQKQRENASRLGFTVDLVDRGKLNRLLSPLLPDRPWLEIMEWDCFWKLDNEVKDYFRSNTSSARQNSRQLKLF
jgi:hypothetical protein